MLLDNETVLHIIEDNFMDDVEHEVLTSVMSMDGYDLSEHFDDLVDYGDLEGIDELEVEEFTTEKEEECQTVSGTLQLLATVGAYVHWDGEDEYVESCEMKMEFSFYFEIADQKYRAFEIEYLW